MLCLIFVFLGRDGVKTRSSVHLSIVHMWVSCLGCLFRIFKFKVWQKYFRFLSFESKTLFALKTIQFFFVGLVKSKNLDIVGFAHSTCNI